MLDYESHCAHVEAEWAKERDWCVVCDAEINFLAARGEVDCVQVISGLGHVCTKCFLAEVESLEGSAA